MDTEPTEPTEPTHMCPPEGSGVTPCCGRTPFELSQWHDRLTTDPNLVTCTVLEDLALADLRDDMAAADADLAAGRTKSLKEIRAELS